ncbi:sensor histidine kinase [Cellulomonas massiliensis]|uniref:sensor histidine kinase n=1 Tax=Cellulomonas massiliensis TaxID=1465811 RepID=UPI0003180DD2|nr:ATP-binding protein [Cellulomonas massiliensis]
MPPTSALQGPLPGDRPDDLRGDRVSAVRATGIVATGYGLGAAMQSSYIYASLVPQWEHVSIWARLGANLVAVLALVGALWFARVHLARGVLQLSLVVVVAATVAATARVGAQLVLGVYDDPDAATTEAELGSGFAAAAIAASIGAWGLIARRLARVRVRAAERDAMQVELAVRALEQEEIRVRGEVAEGLHGTFQGRFVVVEARLGDVLARGRLDLKDAADVAFARDEIRQARDVDVRELSRALYPDRLELGLVPAVRSVVGRIPPSVATRLQASDAVRELDDPAEGRITQADRLLAVRVVEEGVTNALKNGPATRIVVDLDVADGELLVSVENDGQLYDPEHAGRESGTQRLRGRLQLVGGTVTLEPGAERGAVLRARLPLDHAGSEI